MTHAGFVALGGLTVLLGARASADGVPVAIRDELARRLTASVVGVHPLGNFAWSGGATGVVVDRDGHVVTSASRVYGAETVQLRRPGAPPMEARVVGIDRRTDVAVLAPNGPASLAFVAFGGEDPSPVLGEDVAIIAYPPGLDGHIVSRGIVSRLRCSTEPVHGFWFGDEPVFQVYGWYCEGFQGAPVVNSRGELMGMVLDHIPGQPVLTTAKPLSAVRESVREIVANDADVARPRLACVLTGRSVQGGPATYRVADVTRGGAADRAGLRPGDIIRSVNGVRLDTLGSDLGALRKMRGGQEASFVLERGGRVVTVPVIPDVRVREPRTRGACESQPPTEQQVMIPVMVGAGMEAIDRLSLGGGKDVDVAREVLPGVVCLRSASGGGGASFCGFCIDAEQHVVSVGHRLEADVPVAGIDAFGEVVGLKLVGHDPWTDTAVFRPKGESKLVPLALATREVAPDGPVYVLGNVAPASPFSLLLGMGVPEGAAGDGIRDPLGIPRYLRIASRFFRGCDGAPILTAGGAVFGMVRGGDAHAEALTWVERMDDVLLVARQIIEAGDNFERPQIGLHLDPSSGGDRTWRPVIAAVEEQSPAAAAGLRAGDVVRSINGSAVGTPSLAWREMCKLRADEPVVLHVERDGDDVEAVLTPKAVERGWL